MLPLDDARAFVLGRVAPLPVVEVAPAEAAGLVAASDVASPLDLPPFDNAAVDGFAVRHRDVAGASPAGPVVLPVVATRLAGDGRPATVAPGTCVRTMTGAPVPTGADAMVMVEDASPVGEDAVALARAVDPGTGIRPAGSDVSTGQTVVEAGTVVGPAHVGVLASLGLSAVPVHRRPVVGVLSTGDELVAPGAVLAPGQIYDSNRVMLLAAASAAGFDTVDLGCAPDDRRAITEAIRRGVERCDAVLSSGGVSMGDVDLVKVVLDEMGDMRWMQLAIKPAKPFAFGLVDGTPVFGLPGNPVSSLVSFHLLALPGLRRMAGIPDPLPPTERAVAAADLVRRPDGKTHFLRVVSAFDGDGRRLVSPVAAQGSHQLAASAGADALAVLPDGDTVPAGSPVDVVPL